MHDRNIRYSADSDGPVLLPRSGDRVPWLLDLHVPRYCWHLNCP